MAIHPPAGNPGHSGLGDLSGDLSFNFSPPQPGGPTGTDPGLWLAGNASGGASSDLPGGTNSPNSHDQGAALQYLIGQQKPDSITLPTTPSGAESGASISLPPVGGVDFTSGLPGLTFLGETKPSGGGGQGGGGGHHGGGGGGSPPVPYTNGSLTFEVTYDSSVNNVPSSMGGPTAFENGFATAIQYFLNNFQSPITINLDVGWGEVLGHTLPSGALGASDTYLQLEQYSQFDTSMNQNGSVGSVPMTDPLTGNHNYLMANAEAKALGLLAPSTSVDGGVGFGTLSGTAGSWDFSGGVPKATSYDFVGVAEHEVAETMGRIALLGERLGNVKNSYSPFDLFRFDTAGGRSLSGGKAAQYSFDGGKTLGSSFNTALGADYGDWASSSAPPAGSTPDAYNAYGYPGFQYVPSAGDQTLIAALGYGPVTNSSPV